MKRPDEAAIKVVFDGGLTLSKCIDADKFLEDQTERCNGCRPIVGTGTPDNRYLEYCLQDADEVDTVYIVVEDCVVDYQECSRIRFVSFSEDEAEEFASDINNKRGSKYAASVIELDIGENFVSL